MATEYIGKNTKKQKKVLPATRETEMCADFKDICFYKNQRLLGQTCPDIIKISRFQYIFN